jgi:intein/homing endonuclease
MSDGHIELVDGRRPKKVLLYSSDYENCRWFKQKVESLFRVKGKIERYKSITGYSKVFSYKTTFHNAVLARILVHAGASAGDKVSTAYRVPKWIREGNKRIKSAFLRTYFDFEGSKPFNRAKPTLNSWSTYISVSKIEELREDGLRLFRDIKEMLSEFGVRTCNIHIRPGRRRKKDNRLSLIFMLFIFESRSIVNFARLIGFRDQEKAEALSNGVKALSKKIRIRPNENTRKLICKIKENFGTDRRVVEAIATVSSENYSKRMIGHFRRCETWIPLNLLYSIVTIMNNEKSLDFLPDEYRYLFNIWKEDHLSLFPTMNSSKASLASASEN